MDAPRDEGPRQRVRVLEESAPRLARALLPTRRRRSSGRRDRIAHVQEREEWTGRVVDAVEPHGLANAPERKRLDQRGEGRHLVAAHVFEAVDRGGARNERVAHADDPGGFSRDRSRRASRRRGVEGRRRDRSGGPCGPRGRAPPAEERARSRPPASFDPAERATATRMAAARRGTIWQRIRPARNSRVIPSASRRGALQSAEGEEQCRQTERRGGEAPGALLLLQRVGSEGRERADSERRQENEPVVEREREERQGRDRRRHRRQADEEREAQKNVQEQEPSLPPARSERRRRRGRAAASRRIPRRAGPGRTRRAPVPRRRRRTARGRSASGGSAPAARASPDGSCTPACGPAAPATCGSASRNGSRETAESPSTRAPVASDSARARPRRSRFAPKSSTTK